MDMTRAKKIAGDVISDVKAAGKVAALQAKKTKLRTVNLPATFKTLGESLSQDESLRQAFGTHFDRLDVIEADLATLNQQSDEPIEADGLADKAKQAKGKAKAATQKQLLLKQRAKALTELGKAAFESQELAPGHEDEFTPVADIESQLSVIEGQIAELEASSSTSFLSPSRILMVGAVFLGGLALCVPLMMDSNDAPSSDSQAATATNDTDLDINDIENAIFQSPTFATLFKNDQGFAKDVKDTQVRLYGEVVSVGSRTYTKEVDGKHKTFNNSIVRLAGLSPEYTVWCDLNSVREDARSLVGTELAIEGTCWGLSAANSQWEHIALKQCTIIAANEDVTPEAFAALGWTAIANPPDAETEPPELPTISGRAIQCSVATPKAFTITSRGRNDGVIIGHWNGGIQSLACIATEDELVIDFDYETPRAFKDSGSVFNLVVRLFDRNGQYLSHFKTAETFTFHPTVYKQVREIYDKNVKKGIPTLTETVSRYNVTLMSTTGNRLIYPVNTRDLQHVSIVEIGFAVP